MQQLGTSGEHLAGLVVLLLIEVAACEVVRHLDRPKYNIIYTPVSLVYFQIWRDNRTKCTVKTKPIDNKPSH